MSIPSDATIARRLKELRTLVETSSDPIVSRIAYSIEQAIIWARRDTHHWSPPAKEALEEAAILWSELRGKWL
jgi:hypothetical protein